MMEKLKYSISYFDVSEMKPGARDVIELFKDGETSDKAICTREQKNKRKTGMLY